MRSACCSADFAIQYDAFNGWDAVGKNGETFFPFLFITIACGACSGFHSLIASGTTSKQLRRETDAQADRLRRDAAGSDGRHARAGCVMILHAGATLLDQQGPNLIYAGGLGEYLERARHRRQGFAIAFGLMAFTTFVYDTLDVCTRLGRYIIQELTGCTTAAGRWLGTALTAGVPLFFVLRTTLDANGQADPVVADVLGPVRREQSIAGRAHAAGRHRLALADAAQSAGLARHRLPTVLMYAMSTWALVKMTLPKFFNAATGSSRRRPIRAVGRRGADRAGGADAGRSVRAIAGPPVAAERR